MVDVWISSVLGTSKNSGNPWFQLNMKFQMYVIHKIVAFSNLFVIYIGKLSSKIK